MQAGKPMGGAAHRVRHEAVDLAAGAVDGQDDGQHEEGDDEEHLQACGARGRAVPKRGEARVGLGRAVQAPQQRRAVVRALVRQRRRRRRRSSKAPRPQARAPSQGCCARSPMRRILMYSAASMPAQRITSASLIRMTWQGGAAGGQRGGGEASAQAAAAAGPAVAVEHARRVVRAQHAVGRWRKAPPQPGRSCLRGHHPTGTPPAPRRAA